MSADYELTINDYFSILRRRWWQIAAIFLSILALAILTAILLPPVYRSTGTILVESAQISEEVLASSVTTLADERIEVIRQRVMTRENLLRIIDRYRLYTDGYQSLTISEKIDEMRNHISIEMLSANAGKGGAKNQVTIAFRLSFDDRYPEVAHGIANELVTLFLDENVKSRTQRASDTTEFLDKEAGKLKAELDVLESQVAAYKQSHGNALPEHLQLHMDILARTEAELKEVVRDYKTAQEELRYLDLELSAAKAGMTPRTGVIYAPQTVDNGAQELERLRADYAKVSALYKEAHPDVRALKRKIAALETATSGGASSSAPTKIDQQQSLEVSKVEAKISAANVRLASLAEQQKALRAKMTQYEGQIVQTPQVERGLTTLLRDYENAKTKYNEIRAKQMNAEIAESMEQENRSERFALLEPPIRPDKPVKPDRKKMIALGFFLALAGSGGVVMALESINQRIRGAAALTAILHQKPLVSIPYITVDAERGRRVRWIKRAMVVGAVLLLTVLISIHFLYMPLDMLVLKVMARFG